ncbi:MAG: hypothetical protein [Olavius algarvensis Gamma 1 endosymbiont]|nr:MAG: hypothetical protein [Olavius algarvensis Gamma 1 endosymbiont]
MERGRPAGFDRITDRMGSEVESTRLISRLEKFHKGFFVRCPPGKREARGG